ncbi:MAG: HAD family phosphatase [Deltaproteobacteria bacterium]|nr:HAD family phosphatase [Deltaproteobacteria bacterium]
MPSRVLFLDCDGTLTQIKSSWEYLHRRLNLWDDLAEHFQRLYLEGKIDYYEFCRKDAYLWAGRSLKEVLEIVKEIPLTKGAEKAIKILKDMGFYTVIVSTGLSLVVNRVKELLGIDLAVSNELLTSDGFITGKIKINVEQGRKDRVVKNVLKRFGLRREDAFAIGDGVGDLTMFQSVGVSIGFNPEPEIIPYVNYSVTSDNLLDVVPLLELHR